MDLTYQPIRRGDTLILCSDGLSGLVRQEEFATLARQYPNPPALCSALIDLANARGGPDNITVVTALFEGEGLPEPDGAEGVGYQTYQLPQASPPGETGTAEGMESSTSSASGSALSLDRLRNLGLIVLLLGVLMLLLAVWR